MKTVNILEDDDLIDPEAGTFTYVVNEDKPNMAVLVITREQYGKKSALSWIDAI